MKKVTLFIFIFLSLCLSINAQSRRTGLMSKRPNSEKSLSISAGPTYLFGDLGGAKVKRDYLPDMNFRDLSLLSSLGFNQRFYRSNIGYRTLFQYGYFVANDLNSRFEYRGYTSKSHVLHFTLQAEYAFLQREFLNGKPHGFYIFVGIGVSQNFTNFTNMPEIAGNIIKEDETALYLPFGGGYEMKLSPKIKIGVELYAHYYFSDFIDGMQTNVSKYDDILCGISFTFAYTISGRKLYKF